MIVPGVVRSDDSSVTVASSGVLPSPQLIVAVCVFATPGSVKATGRQRNRLPDAGSECADRAHERGPESLTVIVAVAGALQPRPRWPRARPCTCRGW